MQSILNSFRELIRKTFDFLQQENTRRFIGFVGILFSFFLTAAFISYLYNWSLDQSQVRDSSVDFLFDSELRSNNAMGRLGSYLSHAFFFRFGLASFVVVIALFLTGLKLFLQTAQIVLADVYKYAFLTLVLGATLLSFFIAKDLAGFPYGGNFGNYMSNWLSSFIGYAGTGILLTTSAILLIITLFSIDVNAVAESGTIQSVKNFRPSNPFASWWQARKEKKAAQKAAQQAALEKSKEKQNNEPAAPKTPTEEAANVIVNGEQSKISFVKTALQKVTDKIKPRDKSVLVDIPETEINELIFGDGDYDPLADLSLYQKPGIELLQHYEEDLYSPERVENRKKMLEGNKEQIRDMLGHYNVQIEEEIKITPGPTVTLYEIIPEAGIRVSRIRNLEDDIALSLKALGIRIIAPMPGKGTVGIEVPNRIKEIVSLRTVLMSDKFQNTQMDLPIALGRTIENVNYVADLAKMPHMLIAGATGQGKSVCINAILTSLLYQKHPAELKLVLIDPKKVELSLFEAIENHFLAKLPDEEEAIVTDIKKVIATINSLCIEMDRRYDLLKKAHVRNIRGYNIKYKKRKLNPINGHRFLPYIVLVIDEFADLIMTAGKEVEMPIARLAQLARAVGIHLVIATQRPSVNIITGTIKANFPVRIAFKVSSKVDSRTIIDTNGADQLIGRGDMLVSLGGNLIRLQGAFIDTHEVEAVTHYISEQQSYGEAFPLPEYGEDDESLAMPFGFETDELFEEAAHLIVQHQQGSTSMIQRRLRLGYNRAGRIMDQLEAAGIVGPNAGSKAREVLILDSLELEAHLQRMNGG